MSDGSTDDNLKSLEQLYIEGNFDSALDGLLSLKSELSPGHFHYNMGTLYAKTGKYAASRYHLEKSISEGHINSKVLNNLSFVKEKIQPDDLNLSPWGQTLMTLSPFSFYLYLLISLIFVMNLLLAVRFQKLKSPVLIGIFTLLSLFPISFKHFYLNKLNFAIGMEDIQIYEGPSKIYAQTGQIKAGSKVLVRNGGDGWFYIEVPTGHSGWVFKKDLGFF